MSKFGKIMINILCYGGACLLYGLVSTSIRYAGYSLGGIPTVILLLALLYGANKLVNYISERPTKEEKSTYNPDVEYEYAYVPKKINFKKLLLNKKFVISSLAIATICGIVLIFYAFSIPSNMDRDFYKTSCKILDITDSYLDYEIYADTAHDKILNEMRKFPDLNRMPESNTRAKEITVAEYCRNIMSKLGGEYVFDSEVLKCRNDLAEALDKSERN